MPVYAQSTCSLRAVCAQYARSVLTDLHRPSPTCAQPVCAQSARTAHRYRWHFYPLVLVGRDVEPAKVRLRLRLPFCWLRSRLPTTGSRLRLPAPGSWLPAPAPSSGSQLRLPNLSFHFILTSLPHLTDREYFKKNQGLRSQNSIVVLEKNRGLFIHII